MTREEFLDVSVGWNLDDLIDFAQENELSLMDDLISEDNLDSAVCEDIREATHNVMWTTIRDKLGDIEDGWSWYQRGEPLEFYPVDDDWLRGAIVTEMDDYELWDAEDDDEEDGEEEPFHDPEEERVDEVQRELSEGVFSIDTFLENSSGELQVLRAEAEEAGRAAGEAEKLLDEMAAASGEEGKPVCGFSVGDPVQPTEESDRVYGVTCRKNNWKGIVTAVRDDGTIRVKGSGNDELYENEFLVEPRYFEPVSEPEPASENIEDLWRW